MCQTGSTPIVDARKRRLLSKVEFSPEEERAYRWLLSNYRDALTPVEQSISEWLSSVDETRLSSLSGIEASIHDRIGVFASDFEVVFSEGGQRGAAAGRAMAARQFGLDVDFDVVPERTLDEIDDWVSVASESTMETISQDSAQWLRGAHEEGLDMDSITDRMNDELFEGWLEDHVAERAARTATIGTSNAGTHSAIEDSSAIAEEWLTSLDGRERETHADANGQIVPVGRTFLVGGEELAHPGDPSGPLEETIQCRCTVMPRWPDDLDEDERAAIEAGQRLYAST